MLDTLKACACASLIIAAVVMLIAELTAFIWFPILCVFCGYMAGRG